MENTGKWNKFYCKKYQNENKKSPEKALSYESQYNHCIHSDPLALGMDPAQNAMLKKLLARNNVAKAAAAASGKVTPSSEHSEVGV